MKTRDPVEYSHKLCRGFQQAMEARTTRFISFINLLFSLLTKTIHEARTVNSHNSETVKPHCLLHFRASYRYEKKHTSRPIKTHVLSKSFFKN